MSAPRDSTIGSRVPLDLREDLQAITAAKAAAGETRGDGEPVDLSTTIRRGLRYYADLELGNLDRAAEAHAALGLPTGARFAIDRTGNLLDNGRPGASRSRATPTERAAALGVAPRAGTQRRRALELFEAAGDRGLTADEVVVKLAPAPHNGVARRVTDLLQGELIEPRPHDDEDVRRRWPEIPATRLTRAGAQATVYRITGAGLLALTNKRRQEAGR